ncbi:MAG: serine/threonine protein kinase [Myxococcales bacterium]|nr:serine/threonine protein kinase [Myxococcales bacterium]
MPPTACPSPAALAACLDGDGDPATRAHVAGCATCAARLTGLRATEADAGGGEASAAPSRGATIDRYLVIATLGRGGMGVVVSAYDPELDRRVAVKLIAQRGGSTGDRSGGQARLVREAKAMARLSHPNVVPVFDAGTHAGDVFVAMELCEGGTLRQHHRAAPPPWPEVLAAFVAAGRGLAAAHAAGLVHRDFKPDNVLVTASGEIKVSDFGLVTAAPDAPTAPARPPVAGGDALTQTGSVVGTPRYMAPEQFSGGAIDARCDQFSFCASLYEALWRARAPAHTTFAALAAADELTAPGADDPVPLAIQHAIVRGLALDADARFPTMPALLAELAPPPRARRWPAALVALAAAGGAIAIATRLGATTAADRCPLPAANLDGDWTAAHQQRLRAAFAASGRSYAAESGADAIATIDAYVGAWARASRDACQHARALGADGAALAARQLGCLARRRDAARALILELIAHPDDAALAAGPAATARLPAIADCADAEALAARPQPTPAEAPMVREVERALAAIDAQLAAGHYPAAAAALPAVVARSERLGFAPLNAEVLAVRAEVQATTGALAAATRDLHAAAASARRLGLPEVEARAWRSLATSERLGGDHEAALAAAQMLGALAARADDRLAQVDATLLQVRHAILLGELARAHALMRDVAPLVPAAAAVDWRLGGRWALARGGVATARGDVDAATAADREAHAIFVAHLGPDHPELAYVEARLASDAFERGDTADARRWLARSRRRVRDAAQGDALGAELAINTATIAALLGDDPTPALAEAEAATAGLPADALLVLELRHARGLAAFGRGDFAAARDEFAAVAVGARGREARLEVQANENLAKALTMRGDAAAAVAPAQRALALRRSGDNPWATALAAGTLARILAAAGDPAGAEAHFAPALATLTTAPPRLAAAVAELTVAHAINLEALGRAAAIPRIEEATLAALRTAGDSYYLGVALMYAADQRWRGGDRGGALAAAREAREALRRDGDAGGEMAELEAWERRHR